jgi:hypothetical protein
MEEIKYKLRKLYNDASKHSNYQNIPQFVMNELGYSETIDENWRGDSARYRYILGEVDLFPSAVVGDVGANTGFFALSLGNHFKDCAFTAYEANTNHVQFIQLVIDYFELDNVRVKQSMVDLSGIDELGHHDVLLHLNVLHHAGHDFDHDLIGKVEDFESYAFAYLGKLGAKTSRIIFQMGSNWGGNKAMPIIKREDDCAKIMLISKLFINTGWDIVKIALATRDSSGTIVYRNLPERLLDQIKASRDCGKISELATCVRTFNLGQFEGEFYRRPMFICDSRKQVV